MIEEKSPYNVNPKYSISISELPSSPHRARAFHRASNWNFTSLENGLCSLQALRVTVSSPLVCDLSLSFGHVCSLWRHRLCNPRHSDAFTVVLFRWRTLLYYNHVHEHTKSRIFASPYSIAHAQAWCTFHQFCASCKATYISWYTADGGASRTYSCE